MATNNNNKHRNKNNATKTQITMHFAFIIYNTQQKLDLPRTTTTMEKKRTKRITTITTFNVHILGPKEPNK